MISFNFEKNLEHQTQAVDNTVRVFEGIRLVQPTALVYANKVNPVFDIATDLAYKRNIQTLQQNFDIGEPAKPHSNIIDIMMETGTGKTYTYTKTIFELNKQYGVFKFMVVVPTLSIKAGTIDFLKSDSSREHYKEQYGKSIRLHIVESPKNKKNKKSYIPPAISSFVDASNVEKNTIQVLIINAGMINSETLQKSFDKKLYDTYTVPFEALAATRSLMIIDEPHKFAQSNKTWENIQKIQPQFILRYGATFPDKEIEQKNKLTGKKEKTKVKDYHNLVYQLRAVDAFNKNLVKGVIGHITEFEAGKNAIVRFVSSDGNEATFELKENNTKKDYHLIKGDSLAQIHAAMEGLLIENLNKNSVLLSNGKELKKTESLNPYSYAESLQEIMIQKAVQQHFALEKDLLTRPIRIKPLTLFFIDNIEAYRQKEQKGAPEGYLRKTLETYIKAEVEKLLQTMAQDTTEPNALMQAYKKYLEKTLLDISATHGGYFSKDNAEKDEAIEKEINEILHDKRAMLDLDNPRRFIFSKWTLREGWDNPNVFQICKLRSSGSEISKLQEVGRGLRLPVNEYGNRVKDEQFYLNYFVDFTESDFIDSLVDEINSHSKAVSIEATPERLSDLMKEKICTLYHLKADDLLDELVDQGIIKGSGKFKEGGLEMIKQQYPLIFEGVNSNKIRKATDRKKNISFRVGKYDELKSLWEKLNEKVILEYKFDHEAAFKAFFTDFMHTQKTHLLTDRINERLATVSIEDNRAFVSEAETIAYGRSSRTIATMQYSDFLLALAQSLHINIKTVHEAIIDSQTDINPHLNQATVRVLKQNFDHFLMKNAFEKFSIEYQKVSNCLHPTKFTDGKGNPLTEIIASDIGVLFSDEKTADNYLFQDLLYDSDLEKTNIKTKIAEVIVFTKIPKNSIKIPVAGGKSYSPDFAYIIRLPNGEQKLHFIVETKDVHSSEGLRDEEKLKIQHAEKFFAGKIKIEFRTQFSNQKMTELIRTILGQ